MTPLDDVPVAANGPDLNSPAVQRAVRASAWLLTLVAAGLLAWSVVSDRRQAVSQVRDNLIPKLIFWPIILGACFAVSLVFLY